ncbi:MAG: hypothetical protein GY951_17695 [Psychromonas sp.]|nr:hypothetical protein [Candidatus Brocadiaceae bacterium]MCP5079872.1 hypothetical protein [Psychromonas sp.]
MSENLKLWESVETTDPSYTKDFNGKGGFAGTSLNPQYLAKKATDKFGAFGLGWGVDIVKESIVEGAPLSYPTNENPNAPFIFEKIIEVDIRLWYFLDGNKGEVYQTGNSVFVGKNKWGFFTDAEAKKKAHTDARGKALSLLGFGADVFLGLFDDPTYVQEAAIEHEIVSTESAIEDKEKMFNDHMEWFAAQMNTLSNARSENEVKGCFKKIARTLQTKGKRPNYQEIVRKQMRELEAEKDNKLEEISND